MAYRHQEPTALPSEEAELAAIAWLATRKQGFDGGCLGVGLLLAVAAVAATLIFDSTLKQWQFDLFGSYSPWRHWLVAALIPLGLSRLVYRLLLRRLRPRWIAEATARWGVHADKLAWVARD